MSPSDNSHGFIALRAVKHVKQHSPCLSLQQAKCGFAIILMALYWCTECIPLAVTALLPVILFPMMGIMESSEVFTDIHFIHKRSCPTWCYQTSSNQFYTLTQAYLDFLAPFFPRSTRFVSSTWKTPTCSLLVGSWLPSLSNAGTCIGGSPFKFYWLWGWNRPCKILTYIQKYTYCCKNVK